MATRTIRASRTEVQSLKNGETAVFNENLYADPAVTDPDAVVQGGEIILSNFAGYAEEYALYFDIDGKTACSSQTEDFRGEGSFTTYIDIYDSFKPERLLTSSGIIEVTIANFNESDTGASYSCSFRSNCTVTINVSYKIIKLTANRPTVTQNNSGQYVVSWSATASGGDSDDVVEYTLTYGPNNTLAYKGTGRSVTIDIPEDYYEQSIQFKLTAEYCNKTSEASRSYTARHPYIVAPSNLLVNDVIDSSGTSVVLTWTAAQLQYTAGIIEYTILLDGVEFTKTTQPTYTIYEDEAKEYTTAVTFTVFATAGEFVSEKSNSATFVYKPDNKYVNYWIDGEWVRCIPYYFTDGVFVECLAYCFADGDWREASS